MLVLPLVSWGEHGRGPSGVGLVIVSVLWQSQEKAQQDGQEATGGWGQLGCPVTSVLGVAWGHLSCQPSCRPSCLVQMRFPGRWTSPHTFLSWSPILCPTARNPASRARRGMPDGTKHVRGSSPSSWGVGLMGFSECLPSWALWPQQDAP